MFVIIHYRGADNLRPARKETSSDACQGCARFQQHRDARFHLVSFLQGKAPKEIHAILAETLAPLYYQPGLHLQIPSKQ